MKSRGCQPSSLIMRCLTASLTISTCAINGSTCQTDKQAVNISYETRDFTWLNCYPVFHFKFVKTIFLSSFHHQGFTLMVQLCRMRTFCHSALFIIRHCCKGGVFGRIYSASGLFLGCVLNWDEVRLMQNMTMTHIIMFIVWLWSSDEFW